MAITRGPRVPCTSTPPTSSFTALKENAHFIFPTARHQHIGCELARRAVGKMKCAFSFNAVKLLVGGVLVHGTLGSRIITMNPGVKMIRVNSTFLAWPISSSGSANKSMNSADMGNSLLETKHAFYGLSSFFRGLLFARSNWTHAKGLRAIAEEYQRFGPDIGKLIVVLSGEKDDLVFLNNLLCAINAFDRALAIDDQKGLR